MQGVKSNVILRLHDQYNLNKTKFQYISFFLCMNSIVKNLMFSRKLALLLALDQQGESMKSTRIYDVLEFYNMLIVNRRAQKKSVKFIIFLLAAIRYSFLSKQIRLILENFVAVFVFPPWLPFGQFLILVLYLKLS